jgi:hypothetical protein
MHFDLAFRRSQTVRLSTWVFCAALATGFALVCWLLIYILINGPSVRAAIESQRIEEIKQDDQEHCAKLGMPPGTEAFATCGHELAGVRQRHDERIYRDLQFP